MGRPEKCNYIPEEPRVSSLCVVFFGREDDLYIWLEKNMGIINTWRWNSQHGKVKVHWSYYGSNDDKNEGLSNSKEWPSCLKRQALHQVMFQILPEMLPNCFTLDPLAHGYLACYVPLGSRNMGAYV